MLLTVPPDSDLPLGWTARVPGPDDVADLARLVLDHQRAVRGRGSLPLDTVQSSVVGTGSWTRRQVLVGDDQGRVRSWVAVHDRAAGRTAVDLVVAPDLSATEADRVAAVLLDWVREAATEIARMRSRPSTQLDATAYAEDGRLQQWLAAADYQRVRRWLQMSRPVDPREEPEPPRPGVRVRRVAEHESGAPVAADLHVVHRMLEESFADHFNSYRESVAEFVQRLREDPGHRWDHWWIAEVETEGTYLPGGALVSSVLPEDGSGAEGSYVDYIGVHRRARGRGVAKALLGTVVRDARDLGRNRVALEVDADSPTGADGLYRALGWTTAEVTESWHADLHL